VDVSNGDARQLTFGKTRNDSDPEWSPDGKWIAYVSQNIGPDLREYNDSSEIFIVSASGGAPHAVTAPLVGLSSPRWSPDSQMLAYAAAPIPSDQPLLFLTSISGAGKPVLASLYVIYIMLLLVTVFPQRRLCFPHMPYAFLKQGD